MTLTFMETWRPWLLVAMVSSPLTIAGFIVAGLPGIVAALALWAIISTALFLCADRIILKASEARPLAKEEAPHLVSMVRSLSTWASVQTPGLFVVESAEPNAFVIGRPGGQAGIVLTRSLLQLMEPDELKGILAHSIAHIKHGDHTWSSYAAAIAGVLIAIPKALRRSGTHERARSHKGHRRHEPLAMLLTPLVRLSSTREQEFRADSEAIRITGTAHGLARALQKAAAAGAARPSILPLHVAQPLLLHRQMNRYNPRPRPEERLARLGWPA